MPTVLILDRDAGRRNRLVSLLGQIDSDIEIETFIQPGPALSWLYWRSVDLIISDCRFRELDSVELIGRIRTLPEAAELPVLMMVPVDDQSLRRRVLEAGATDLINSPVDEIELRARCQNLLTQRFQQAQIRERALWLEKQVNTATSEVLAREHETLLRLAKAGEYRDEETGNHVLRMAKYARLIAEKLGLDTRECETIEMAAPMHDIGKIGIPDFILRKPGRLTHQEFEVMKTHTRIGHEILKDSPSRYLQLGAVIALNHHEKFNGTGYPNQLGKDDIPLCARIVSVADAYDALTSERPYKRKWSSEKALEYLQAQSGKYFDPQCLEAFLAQFKRVASIQATLCDKPYQACI